MNTIRRAKVLPIEPFTHSGKWGPEFIPPMRHLHNTIVEVVELISTDGSVWQQIPLTGYQWVFRSEWLEFLPDTILMSFTNPDGWKLEELLETITKELVIKSEKLENSDCPAKGAIQANNAQICTLLKQARRIQLNTMDMLASLEAEMSKNQENN